MLKSQQRKVRQMIEQMQSSRTQIEEKDLLIQQLQERVEHLESENREMQDRLEYVTSHKVSSSATSQQYNGRATTDPQVISRHPVGCRKPKALVRVLETS
ncbi:uncharacterized protein [Chiloscyllium punctatum]|uniref:uncharacterized protein isoform X2 n=1 Tax=Chiloscyllium punctatum TaxID=137246 RepID=UPI003B633C54